MVRKPSFGPGAAKSCPARGKKENAAPVRCVLPGESF